MKKSKLIRVGSTCMAIFVFACMAMASGEKKETTQNSVKIGDGGTKSEAADNSATPEDTTAAETENKIQYEVTSTTFTHYTNSINKEEYCGIVEITNTGSAYLYLGDCSFDLEDDDGHLLQSDKYISSAPDVLAPGEKGYYFQNGSIDDGVALDKGVNLVPNYTIEIAKKGADAIVEYEVSDLDLRDEDYGLGVKVTGRISNNTSEETSSIDINLIAIFYGSDGKILDIGFTYPDAMAPGTKTSFEISTAFGNREFSAKDVSDYMVIARKSVLNL